MYVESNEISKLMANAVLKVAPSLQRKLKNIGVTNVEKIAGINRRKIKCGELTKI